MSNDKYNYESDDERTIRELVEKLYALVTDPRPGLATWTMTRNAQARTLRDALNRVIDGPVGAERMKALDDAGARVMWLREMLGIGLDADFLAKGITAMKSESEDANFVENVKHKREAIERYFLANRGIREKKGD